MKLRLQSNSIRLRLKKGEVDHLVRTGRVEEKIVFGPGHGGALTYVLETSSAVSEITASLKEGVILVRVPTQTAHHWAASDDVGMEIEQATENKGTLLLLIEKDFACLNGTAEQNADTFPHPLEGTTC